MRECFVILFCFLSFSIHADELERDLKDLEGKTSIIQNYTGDGKWLIVMIWASDCSVCSQTAPKIVDFHERHKDKDMSVLGIALDGYEERQAVVKFIDRNALTFPNLIAEMPDFALRYEFEVGERLLGTPTYLVFSPDGELVANNPGPVEPAALERFIAARTEN